MPDDRLIWTDVHFDQAVAHEAAAECLRAARLLRDTTLHRSDLAQRALATGRGPWRDQLIGHLALLERRSAELEARLRGLADALQGAAARARIEQVRREAARTLDLGHLGTASVPG